MASIRRFLTFVLASTCAGACQPPMSSSRDAPGPVDGTVCERTLTSDQYTPEGINTRTGCLLVDMAIGSVTGADDLSLPVSLVRNEGNPPAAGLYANGSWFGLGTWLSVDEYITTSFGGVAPYVLHTPRGDVIYDFPVTVPPRRAWVADDSSGLLEEALRTRPFDGTFLFVDEYTVDGHRKKRGYTIVVGNPSDRSSLAKHYLQDYPIVAPSDPLMASDHPDSRLLSSLSKASIHNGPRNEIRIKRQYRPGNVTVEFQSSLYDGTGKTPLAIRGALERSDGKPGYEVRAETTLLHGWRSTVIARTNEHGNIDTLESPGRNSGGRVVSWEGNAPAPDKATEKHLTTFHYWNEPDPKTTLFKAIKEQEGRLDDLRTLSWIEVAGYLRGFPHLAPYREVDPKPYAVEHIVDRTQPDAPRAHLVTICTSEYQGGSRPGATYFTFNYADGTSIAHAYGNDDTRRMLVRARDAQGKQVTIRYNPARRGADPYQQPHVATAYEVGTLELKDEGAPAAQLLRYRYDKFSADTYRIPLVGKISIPKGLNADRQVLYRAVFGDKGVEEQAEFDGKKVIRSFLIPRGAAEADGRTRWEYRGLDGFVYRVWDENDVMTSFRWHGEDPNPDGTYDTEVIETSVMGVLQSRATRDRFGRLREITTFDYGRDRVGEPAKSVTTTFHLTPDGVTEKITDTGSGETFTVQAWNAARSAITEATLTRGGSPLASFKVAADDFGQPEGTGTVTLGPLTYTTDTQRLAAGLLKSVTLRGPASPATPAPQTMTSALEYAAGSTSPRAHRLNERVVHESTSRMLTAKEGCK